MRKYEDGKTRLWRVQAGRRCWETLPQCLYEWTLFLVSKMLLRLITLPMYASVAFQMDTLSLERGLQSEKYTAAACSCNLYSFTVLHCYITIIISLATRSNFKEVEREGLVNNFFQYQDTLKTSERKVLSPISFKKKTSIELEHLF